MPFVHNIAGASYAHLKMIIAVFGVNACRFCRACEPTKCRNSLVVQQLRRVGP